MREGIVKLVTGAVFALASLVILPQSAAAAGPVSAVPRLDLSRYMGQWYVVARIPTKKEKRCLSDNLVLYALGEKPRTFQMGTFCTVKGGNPDDLNTTGKMDKLGTGKLKLSHLVLFSTKYWVLATGPDYEWALVGTPNHKALWVLSRTAALSPEIYAGIGGTATAEGFDVAKLVPVSRTVKVSESPK